MPYANERLGIAFTYPKEWTLDASDPMRIVISPGAGAQVQVLSQLVGPDDPDTIMDSVLQSERSGIEGVASAVKVVSETPFPGAAHATRLKFNAVLAGQNVYFDLIVAAEGVRVFEVVAAVRSELLPTMQPQLDALMDSFRVTLEPGREPVQGTGEQLAVVVDAIGQRTVALRGLQTTGPVATKMATRLELRALMEQEIVEDKSSDDWVKAKDFCLVLDMCEEADDLFQEVASVLELAILGFYDDDTKALTLMSEQTDLLPRDWLTLSHEYAHALQDQRFTLSFLDDLDDDEASAAYALVEGDAELASWLFHESLPLQQQKEVAASGKEAVTAFYESGVLESVPRILSATYGWEYQQGVKFILSLYLAGGFEAVNDAFSNLPESSEQIIHPEKYTAGEGPKAVELPDLAAVLGGTWQMTDDGVLGEFMTAVYLGTYLFQTDADSAAAGWGGDRYAVLKDADGRRLMAMRFEWDSELEAMEFASAYQDLLFEKYYDPEPTIEELSEVGEVWSVPGSATLMGSKGAEVWVVIGPDKDAVMGAATAVAGAVP